MEMGRHAVEGQTEGARIHSRVRSIATASGFSRAASVDQGKCGCYEDIAVGSFPKDDPRVERLNLLWTDADLTEVRAERGLRAAIDEARTDSSYRWGWCSHFL